MSLIEAINRGWAWAEVSAAEIHAVSPMGHVLFADEEGCFYYLDTDGMELKPLGSKEAAEAHFKLEETQELWEARGLVKPARERLGDPPKDHVFTLSPTNWIEGNYDADEVCILPLEEIVFLSGDLARQIKDLPDGSQIQIKIVD